jgi:hypothetical protein
MRNDIQAPRGAGPVQQAVHGFLNQGTGCVESGRRESVLNQSPQTQVLRTLLIDHHPALDALEVLDRASVPRSELAVDEESGLVASQAAIAEGLKDVVVRVTSQAPSIRE